MLSFSTGAIVDFKKENPNLVKQDNTFRSIEECPAMEGFYRVANLIEDHIEQLDKQEK